MGGGQPHVTRSLSCRAHWLGHYYSPCRGRCTGWGRTSRSPARSSSPQNRRTGTGTCARHSTHVHMHATAHYYVRTLSVVAFTR